MRHSRMYSLRHSLHQQCLPSFALAIRQNSSRAFLVLHFVQVFIVETPPIVSRLVRVEIFSFRFRAPALGRMGFLPLCIRL